MSETKVKLGFLTDLAIVKRNNEAGVYLCTNRVKSLAVDFFAKPCFQWRRLMTHRLRPLNNESPGIPESFHQHIKDGLI